MATRSPLKPTWHAAPALQRRPLGLGLLALAAAVALPGCAGLLQPRSLTLDAAEIQHLLDRRFPQDRRLLEVLDVRVSAPRARLLPETNRVGAVLDIQAEDRVFGGRWQGRLDVDATLRWQGTDQTLRLDQVRVQDLARDPGGSAARSAAERLGAVVAERLLEGLPLYQLAGEPAARLQRAGLQPAGVTVLRQGVEITLQPVPR